MVSQVRVARHARQHVGDVVQDGAEFQRSTGFSGGEDNAQIVRADANPLDPFEVLRCEEIQM